MLFGIHVPAHLSDRTNVIYTLLKTKKQNKTKPSIVSKDFKTIQVIVIHAQDPVSVSQENRPSQHLQYHTDSSPDAGLRSQ